MRAHIIEDNIVVNTIEVDSLNFMPGLIDGSVGSISWVWDGKNLTDPNASSEADIVAMKWDAIRAERNELLATTDWWVIKAAETGAAINDEQHTYRQTLRDITEQADPFNIVWPEPPTT